MQAITQHWENTLIDLVKSANEKIYLRYYKQQK